MKNIRIRFTIQYTSFMLFLIKIEILCSYTQIHHFNFIVIINFLEFDMERNLSDDFSIIKMVVNV